MVFDLLLLGELGIGHEARVRLGAGIFDLAEDPAISALEVTPRLVQLLGTVATDRPGDTLNGRSDLPVGASSQWSDGRGSRNAIWTARLAS